MKNLNLSLILLILTSTFLSAQVSSRWDILNEGLGPFKDIDFADAINGWLLEDTKGLWRTENGGENWFQVVLPDTLQLENLKFTSVSAGWAIGYSDNRNRQLYQTEDGGKNWSPSSNLPEYYDLQDLAVVNDSVAYMTGIIKGLNSHFDIGDALALTAGDMNGDGYIDFALSTYDDVYVLLNNGDYTFQQRDVYTIDDSYLNSIIAVDLDGDSDADLTLTNRQSILVLKNNGDGTFQEGYKYTSSIDVWSTDVCAADLDGDLDVDLAVTTVSDEPGPHKDGVWIFKNNGDATFQDPVHYSIGDGPNEVTASDLDGDADIDLAIADSSYVSFLLNDGTGAFNYIVNYPTIISSVSIKAGDINFDGYPDLITSYYGVSVWINNGDSTFQEPVYYEIPGQDDGCVDLADVDNDEDIDIIASPMILMNNGDGIFYESGNYPVGRVAVFCDIDLDGFPDLAGLERFMINDGDGHFNPVENYKEGVGWAEYAGWIYKTTDSGASWEDLPIPGDLKQIDFTSVYFDDAGNGIATGTSYDSLRLIRTTDGGINWKKQEILPFNSMKNVQFVNDNDLYFLASNDQASYLGFTDDLFDNMSIIFEYERQISTYFSIDENTIFACIEDTNGIFNIMKSTDGGYNWQTKYAARGEQIYFSTEQAGFMLSSDGLYKSTDAGDSWQPNYFNEYLTDVFFLDNNTGFASSKNCSKWFGCSGNLFKTSDGGKNWRSLQSALLSPLVFVNDLTGYALGSDDIQKTTDQGQSWTMVYENNYDSTGFSINSNDLYFIDEINGWAVGTAEWSDSSGAGVLGTKDGGESWELVWKDPNSWALNSIHTVNGTTWTVGDGGLIVKFTEPNGWQKIPNEIDLDLNNVYFSDENHGWISTGNVIIKTIDSGISWKEIQLNNWQISDLFFIDNEHGWVVGHDESIQGIVLETTDAGENWNTVVAGLSAPLNALYFKDSTGWAVGDNGFVLKTDDLTTWINTNNGKVYSANYRLFQNYPNPFNPKTTIEFQIPNSQFTTLKVYDILGKEVLTIVSNKLNQGNHSYTFDGQNLASGIYYYQLVAGEYREVKKMILLR